MPMLKVLPLTWYGSLEREVPDQVSFSSFDHGSELRAAAMWVSISGRKKITSLCHLCIKLSICGMAVGDDDTADRSKGR
ncbi:hypothetical protein TNCV_4069941 [Trichonephila clavipes]|nr:hypothetical protein TNCV_4069941 [Trichonephila clavipes]